MFDKYNAIRSNNHQNLPLECMKNLQRGLGSVDLHAFLTTEDVSEKKPSRLTEVAFHPVRPWIASIEPRGVGIIWNYETKEVVNEFSLEFSYRETTTTSTTPEEEVIKAPTTILKSSSPTASSYVKTLRNKPSTLTMVFYDHEVIRHREGAHAERTCFDEWIIILAGTHVIIIDIHSNSAVCSNLFRHPSFNNNAFMCVCVCDLNRFDALHLKSFNVKCPAQLRFYPLVYLPLVVMMEKFVFGTQKPGGWSILLMLSHLEVTNYTSMIRSR
jgi:hypothetical protein